jgi:hypothetical protein
MCKLFGIGLVVFAVLLALSAMVPNSLAGCVGSGC